MATYTFSNRQVEVSENLFSPKKRMKQKAFATIVLISVDHSPVVPIRRENDDEDRKTKR